MGGVRAIQGVDDTLRDLSTRAVQALLPRPKITVGHLDSDDEELRLNWFLYRVSPNVSHRNMEPPSRGSQSARGRPPLALRLSYLLTAIPAKSTGAGDQEQFAHAALAAVMLELHEHAIIGAGDAVLSPLTEPLVEPLRVTIQDLDLEAVTKLWTAATAPLRLSVGYEVSLVIVDSQLRHIAGPPVRAARIGAASSIGVRLLSVSPARARHGIDISVTAREITPDTVFMLLREPQDPPGSGDWTMTVASERSADVTVLSLPDPGLAPGARRLRAVTSAPGLTIGDDSIGLTVVPAVTGPPMPLRRAVPVTLQTVHAAPDVEVFVAGQVLAAADTAFVSATEVEVTLPASLPSGSVEVVLRAGKVAGDAATIEIAP